MTVFTVRLCASLFPRSLYNVSLDGNEKPFRRKYFSVRQAFFKSIDDGSGGKTNVASNVSGSQTHSSDLHPSGPMRANLLIAARGPLKVLRAIWAVIVDSVDSVRSRWLLSDIGNEKPEVVPTFTNVNATATISVIVSGVGLGASVKHAAPSMIERVFCFHPASKQQDTPRVKEPL